ncbi:AraC family transcriptional regulator [Larkinella knui]|uniref:AraC family transcriptional regulator n=1 Tax=Larkinella knui TaxID=2025310 RepID=A0A3P1CND5_9BACT|nr:helix-turn-helix domain-containing protein [Larkinella knui]RRB14822.1 AraC family transcriptional regulator [Larkinella knui]
MHGIVVIELVGVAQGAFLLLAGWRTGRLSGWPGRLLTALLVVDCLLMGWLALHDSHRLADIPDLIGLGAGLPFLFGPLLYGYVKASVGPAFHWRRMYWLHLIPFALLMLGHIPFHLQPFGQKQTFVVTHYSQPHLDWWGQVPLLHFLLYLIPTFRLIRQHDTQLKAYYSAIEARQLVWLRQLTIGFIIGYGLFAAILYGRGLHPAGYALAFCLTALTYLISYRQLYQPARFATEPGNAPVADAGPERVDTASNLPVRPKYEKSSLTAGQGRLYADQLQNLMQHRLWYLDGTLTLRQVADELALSPHTLSQVLNQTLGVSFYDYINDYRVEAVKRALADHRNDHLTILALALDAGFESKAAFNKAFKKHTGLTPSDYRKQLRTQ